jgi:protein involved in polysaccharide export with SLBB domain
MRIVFRSILGSALLTAAVAFQAGAQTPDSRRVLATREELTAALKELEQFAQSSGFSKAFRKQKETEAALLRERLEQGDLRPGDQIGLTVVGEPTLQNQQVKVRSGSAGSTVLLPGLPEISLQGVLRSELQAHLAKELSRYIRDPQIDVQSFVRLSVLGGVGNPGFYDVPASALASDVVMQAGGPANNGDLKKVEVTRGKTVVLSEEAAAEALAQGLSIDQLNLQGGDQISVGVSRTGNPGGRIRNLNEVVRFISITTGLIFLGARIF